MAGLSAKYVDEYWHAWREGQSLPYIVCLKANHSVTTTITVIYIYILCHSVLS